MNVSPENDDTTGVEPTLGSECAWLVLETAVPVEPSHFMLDPARAPTFTMGRSESCELPVSTDLERFSRRHARFSYDGFRWTITDLQSLWGTHLNGLRLPPGSAVPLRHDDLVRVGPLRFRFCDMHARQNVIPTEDDVTHVDFSAVELDRYDDGTNSFQGDCRRLRWDALTDAELFARGLAAAHSLAVGCSVAIVRGRRACAEVQVVASHGDQAAEWTFSRSALVGATGGTAVVGRVRGNAAVSPPASFVAALPIRLGDDVDSILYISKQAPAHDFSGIDDVTIRMLAGLCHQIGQGLARIRQNEVIVQLAARHRESERAAGEQRMLLPPTDVQHLAGLRCIGEIRAGEQLAGDFFDLVELSTHELAVAVGDVAGHGLVSSVLMAAAHGYLHAMLESTGDAVRAVNALNRFVARRVPSGKFLTAWVGIIDRRREALHYVDAGHSYALLWTPGGSIQRLDGADGLPVGVHADEAYVAVAVTFVPGSVLLVVSDGVVEQRSCTRSSPAQQFSIERVVEHLRTIVSAPDASPITPRLLFEEVERYAGQRVLADDATAVLVYW